MTACSLTVSAQLRQNNSNMRDTDEMNISAAVCVTEQLPSVFIHQHVGILKESHNQTLISIQVSENDAAFREAESLTKNKQEVLCKSRQSIDTIHAASRSSVCRLQGASE